MPAWALACLLDRCLVLHRLGSCWLGLGGRRRQISSILVEEVERVDGCHSSRDSRHVAVWLACSLSSV